MGSREDTIPHVGKHRAEGRKVPDVFPSFVLDLERKPPGLGKEIPEPNISPGTSAVRLGHFYLFTCCLLGSHVSRRKHLASPLAVERPTVPKRLSRNSVFRQMEYQSAAPRGPKPPQNRDFGKSEGFGNDPDRRPSTHLGAASKAPPGEGDWGGRRDRDSCLPSNDTFLPFIRLIGLCPPGRVPPTYRG
jgi:hypothetical protein